MGLGRRRRRGLPPPPAGLVHGSAFEPVPRAENFRFEKAPRPAGRYDVGGGSAQFVVEDFVVGADADMDF